MSKGDICVYFPAGSAIDSDYLRDHNLFASGNLNDDPKQKGYFNKHGIVKATRFMKGAICSTGFILPAAEFFRYYDIKSGAYLEKIGDEFDTVDGKLVVQKYVRPEKGVALTKGKQPKRASRLVGGQVYLHDKTPNYRRNADAIFLDDIVTISDKFHGTSATFQHVLVKRKMGVVDKIAKFFGATIQETEYDLIVTSRRVVKNGYVNDKKHTHFYESDVWTTAAENFDLKNKIPKGYSIYAELVGYVPGTETLIQSGYDYGCAKGEMEMYVYRVTRVNSDGIVENLTTPEARLFCTKYGLTHVPVFATEDLVRIIFNAAQSKNEIVKIDELESADIVRYLEDFYLGRNCPYCTENVPAEGVIIRKEGDNTWDAFKLKDFAFLARETEHLEKESNIEDNN